MRDGWKRQKGGGKGRAKGRGGGGRKREGRGGKGEEGRGGGKEGGEEEEGGGRKGGERGGGEGGGGGGERGGRGEGREGGGRGRGKRGKRRRGGGGRGEEGGEGRGKEGKKGGREGGERKEEEGKKEEGREGGGGEVVGLAWLRTGMARELAEQREFHDVQDRWRVARDFMVAKGIATPDSLYVSLLTCEALAVFDREVRTRVENEAIDNTRVFGTTKSTVNIVGWSSSNTKVRDQLSNAVHTWQVRVFHARGSRSAGSLQAA